MIEWLRKNKEWFFSGLGIVLLSTALAFFGKIYSSNQSLSEDSETASKQEQESNNSTLNIQVQDVPGEVQISLPSESIPGKISEDQFDEQWIIFEPINNIEKRLNNLSIPSEEPTISLHFISTKWHIDHIFNVSKNASVEEVANLLLVQLSLREHASIDLSNFSAPSGCWWNDRWILTANGKPLDPNDTFATADIANGTLLQFGLRWEISCQIISGPDQDEAKTPPDMDL